VIRVLDRKTRREVLPGHMTKSNYQILNVELLRDYFWFVRKTARLYYIAPGEDVERSCFVPVHGWWFWKYAVFPF
jgi:hypothetical protein